jgi:hypothetical protein
VEVINWFLAIITELVKKITPFAGWIVVAFVITAASKMFKLNIKL